MYQIGVILTMIFYVAITLPLNTQNLFKRELICSHLFTVAIFLMAIDPEYKYWTLGLVIFMTMYNAYILLRKRKK